MSKKRLSLILVGIALIAVTGFIALSQTWVSATAMMHLSASSPSGELKIFWDCDASVPVTDINWGSVTQGQRYRRSVFLLNTGTVMLVVYYMPTWYQDTQYKFHIECFVHALGTKCQLNKVEPPEPLLEKTDYPIHGYDLYPGDMIKVDIYLTVETIQAGGVYSFPFEVHGYY